MLNSDVTDQTGAAAPREQQAIVKVKQRLHQRFPQVPPDKIDATVQVQYHRFDHSRIRDFVPIFVERGAREELAALPAPGRG